VRFNWRILAIGAFFVTAALLAGWRAAILAAQPKYEWATAEAGVRASDQAPLTAVTLQTRTTSYNAGVYVGTCTQIDRLENALLTAEVTAIVCSWMDEGVEVGLFQDGQVKELRTIQRYNSAGKSYRDEFRTSILLTLNSNE
jgi:hypothetical protein